MSYIPVLNEQAGGLCAHGFFPKKNLFVLTTTDLVWNSVQVWEHVFMIMFKYFYYQVSKNLNMQNEVKMYGFQSSVILGKILLINFQD